MSPAIIEGLVSVIIPVHNRSAMLREAVESVLCQSYKHFEILIVDDGSTDDTAIAGQALAKDHPESIEYIRKENSGPGPTREAGRRVARGEFIQYLDSDDLLRPRKFELMVNALRRHPECGAAYGYICVHPVGQPAPTKPARASGETRNTLFPWILADRWWNTDCPLFRRSTTDAAGPWSDLRWSQDWEYDARIGALGIRLVHIRDWVCDERHHDTGRQTDPADWLQPDRLSARRRLLELLFAHATKAGVSADDPHRQHFARWAFSTARQCALAGFGEDARKLLRLSLDASGNNKDVARGIRTFSHAMTIFGARGAGRLSALLDGLKRPLKYTMQPSYARDLLS